MWNAGTWRARAEGCEGNCLLPPAHPLLLKTTAGVGHLRVGGAGQLGDPCGGPGERPAWSGLRGGMKRSELAGEILGI